MLYTHVCVLRHVRLFATTWTTRLLCPWNSSGKNTGMGCHFLLQRIFPTQRSNPCLLCLLHWQAGSLPLVPPAKPKLLFIVVCCCSVTQSIQLFETPFTAACQASLSITISWSLLKFISIESLIPSNYLILLYCPLLLPLSIFPSINLFQ